MNKRPTSSALSLLLAIPFGICCAAAVAKAEDSHVWSAEALRIDGSVARGKQAEVAQSLVQKFRPLAGSSKNAENLVKGLRAGHVITLETGPGKSSTIHPTSRPLSYGTIYMALTLVSGSSRTSPAAAAMTPKQLEARIVAALAQMSASSTTPGTTKGGERVSGERGQSTTASSPRGSGSPADRNTPSTGASSLGSSSGSSSSGRSSSAGSGTSSGGSIGSVAAVPTTVGTSNQPPGGGVSNSNQQRVEPGLLPCKPPCVAVGPGGGGHNPQGHDQLAQKKSQMERGGNSAMKGTDKVHGKLGDKTGGGTFRSQPAPNTATASGRRVEAVPAAAKSATQVSSTAKQATQASSVARQATQASSSAREAAQASSSAREAVHASSSAREVVQASASAREAVQASTAAREAVQASTAAREAVQASTAAREAVQASSAAREAVQASSAAKEAVQASRVIQEVRSINDVRNATRAVTAR